jgi:steroid delta-isomerase-like uncharacterized protein
VSAHDELIDRFEAAWSGRDADAFADVCADDLHYEDPLTVRPLESPAELGAHAERLWAGFPDARVERTAERLWSEDGRYVAAPAKLVATHRAELEGLPATGRFVVVQAVFYCETDAARERLWRVRAFFDLYGAAVQLGVLPKPGTLGEKALLMLRGFGVRAGRG